MQDYYLHARAVTRARASLFERLRPPRRRGKPAPASDLGGGVHLFDGHVTIARRRGAARPIRRSRCAPTRRACGIEAPVLPFARDAIARAAADPAWCERLRADARGRAALRGARVHGARDANAPRVDRRRAARRGPAPRDGAGVSARHRPRAPRRLPRVHGRRSLGGRGRSPAPARARRARARVPARVAPRRRDCAPAPALSRDAPARRRQGLARRERLAEEPLEDGRRPLRAHPAAPRPVAGGRRRGARSSSSDHLLMYHVATRRDLDDPATIEEFCRSVRGREGLRNLYLLTVADLLDDVAHGDDVVEGAHARRALLRRRGAPRGAASRGPTPSASRACATAVRAAWHGADRQPLEALPRVDARAVPAGERARVDRRSTRASSRERGRAVGARRRACPSRHPEAAELCVVADDRPGLLASIAAAITANRLEVLAAQVYSRAGRRRAARRSTSSGCATATAAPRASSAALPRLARDLDDVCSRPRRSPRSSSRRASGSTSPWRERPSPAVPTEVLVDDRASPRHTVVEVFAKDRPGLLYTARRAPFTSSASRSRSRRSTPRARASPTSST